MIRALTFPLALLILALPLALAAQEEVAEAAAPDPQEPLYALIADYAEAREERDTARLRGLLTDEADQLVSSGTWRRGIDQAVAGMQSSSSNNPGRRILTVEQVRFLQPDVAIVDARYEIRSPGAPVRRMWSTFVAVREEGIWKIAAIRNMLPAR